MARGSDNVTPLGVAAMKGSPDILGLFFKICTSRQIYVRHVKYIRHVKYTYVTSNIYVTLPFDSAPLPLFIVLQNRWPNRPARQRKTTQVGKTITCVRTCEGRPNGFVSRLPSRSTIKLRSTCAELRSWPNGEKLASISVRIWVRSKTTQMDGQPKKIAST